MLVRTVQETQRQWLGHESPGEIKVLGNGVRGANPWLWNPPNLDSNQTPSFTSDTGMKSEPWEFISASVNYNY